MIVRWVVLIVLLVNSARVFRLACADEELAGASDASLNSRVTERRLMAELRAKERQKLEQMFDLQGWAIRGFDDPLAPNASVYANRSVDVDRFLERRKRTVSHVLSLPPEKLKGRISSGTGLNALQECLGTAALQHEMFLQKMADLPEASRTPEQRERLKILQEMSSELELPIDLVSKIDCYRQGEMGMRLPIQLNLRGSVKLEVLPLDWPMFFQLHPELFKGKMDMIAAAKKACVDADAVNYSSAKSLMVAISELEELVATIQKAQVLDEKIQVGGKWQKVEMSAPDIQRAKNFVRTLKLVVVKFLETLNQPHIDGYRIQGDSNSDRVSIITLLAIMEERSLIFADRNAEPQGAMQDARQRIFSRMREYYGALYALSLEISEQEKEIDYIEGLIDKSFETEQLGMAFDAARLWLDGL